MAITVRPAKQSRQRLLDGLLGLGVERGGGLIEQHDRRIHEEGARDGQSLPLAAGELHAALADERVVALRQAMNEFGAPRGLHGAIDLLVARLRAAVAQVLEQRAMKQRDILLHHRDGAAQALLRDVRDDLAVDERLRPSPESYNLCSSATIVDLPAPERPTRPDLLPAGHMQREVLEHRAGRSDS